MKIKQITIRGIFGVFDHVIPLFSKEPVTIIHGPNGVGKTSVLRLIYGVLRPSIRHLREVRFRDLELWFDDATVLTVTPSEVSEVPEVTRRRSRSRLGFSFRLLRDGSVEQETMVLRSSKRSRGVPHEFAIPLPFLNRVGPDEWHDLRTQQLLSFDDVVELYGDELPSDIRQADEPDWLRAIQRSTPVSFIETQRLLTRGRAPTQRHLPAPEESAVKRCSRELADQVRSTLAKSATMSQTLERTFPSRVLSEGPVVFSEEEIRAMLSSLDQRRSRLIEAGLLEPGVEPTLPTRRFDEITQRVLAVYIRDTEQKLATFDNLLSRIELMKNIIDSRFLQKTLSVDRQTGLVVRTREGSSLDLSGLSSGEQHELVLLYELLFRAEPDTLILIDEPELSLHVAWQQQFLRDLIKIATLAKLRALVATHSPQIIHDRWDLTVELGSM